MAGSDSSKRAGKGAQAPADPHGLSAKQRAFVEQYLVDSNGTKAATRAGYSPRSAHVTAARLLTEAKVKAALAEAQGARRERLEITAERIDRELAAIAFLDVYDLIGENGELKALKDMPEQARRAIASLDVEELKAGGAAIGTVRKVRLADKLRALELLCKRQGLLTERHEHDVQKGSTLEQLLGAAAVIAAQRRKAGAR